MKTKRLRTRRASMPHTRTGRRDPYAESPAPREQALVDASIFFNDSHSPGGRAALWLDSPSSDERSCTTTTF